MFFFSFDQLQAESLTESWPRKYILFQIDLHGDVSQNLDEIVLRNEELIGWFDSLKKSSGQNTRFLESYFQWRKKTDASSEA